MFCVGLAKLVGSEYYWRRCCYLPCLSDNWSFGTGDAHILYLKEHQKRKLGFDPGHPNIDETRFHKFDWEDFYRGVEEAIPRDMPNPRGNLMSTHCFVGSNHGGNKVTTKYQTRVFFLVIWHQLSCSERGRTQLKHARLELNYLH